MENWMQNQDRLESIFNVILDESERGAALLACHIIDDFLKELIERQKPEHVTTKVFKEATSMGGAFGSFGLKLRGLYVMGFISEQSFTAIDKLKSIRNKAAHSASPFAIAEHQDTFDLAIKSFGEGEQVKRLALELAMQATLGKMMEVGNKLRQKIGVNPFESKSDCIDYLSDNDETVKLLEAQMPLWHLATLTYLIVETLHHNFENHAKIFSQQPNA